MAKTAKPCQDDAYHLMYIGHTTMLLRKCHVLWEFPWYPVDVEGSPKSKLRVPTRVAIIQQCNEK